MYASVAEVVDASDLKSGGRKAVWVRLPPFAKLFYKKNKGENNGRDD